MSRAHKKVERFVKARCLKSAGLSVSCRVLYAAFLSSEGGQLNNVQFNRVMVELGYKRQRTVQQRFWLGIGLIALQPTGERKKAA